ncbi:MAG: Cna B-type domain-containing protein, partial [Eubacteriales bacterium]|nr:Cna B-type domain-containing protein [Eubacteriales bacterium]
MKSQMVKTIKIAAFALLACLLMIFVPIPGYAASVDEETQSYIRAEPAAEVVVVQSDTASYSAAPVSTQPAEPAAVEPPPAVESSPKAAEPAAAAEPQNDRLDQGGTDASIADADRNDSAADVKDADAEDTDAEGAGSEGTDAEDAQEEDTDVPLNEAEIIATGENDGVSVEVTAPTGSFREGTNVNIKSFTNAEASSYADAIEENDGAAAFDIYFTDKDGNKVQPESGKSVSIKFSLNRDSALLKSLGSLKIYHIGAEANDLLGTTEISEEGQAVTINVNASEFSPFVVLKTAAEESENAAPLLRMMEANAPKEIDVVLSDLSLVSSSTGGNFYPGSSVAINFKWDATSYGSNLHEGDYFVVNIPSELNLTSYARTPSSFDLANELGIVFATAVVDRTNNKVTATFNNNVEGKYDVKGTMQFNASVSSANTTINEKNDFTFTSGSSVTTVSYDVQEAPGPTWFKDTTILHKNGGFVTWGTPWGPASSQGNITQIQYIVRVNVPEGTTYHNAVITDTLTGADGGDTTSRIIPESFRLIPVEGFDGGGTAINPGTRVDISDMVVISNDGKTFTINFGDISQKFYLNYYATFDYVQGNSVKNEVTLTSDEVTRTTRSTNSVATGSGTADARVANRIRLIKVDEEDNSIRLADAEFEVTAPDGTTFTLKTGSDGTVLSDLLTQGTYTIKETKAPAGYNLNGETITVDLTEEGVLQTVSNARTKTSVNVVKNWNDANDQDGKRPESVTIRLYADGEDTGKTVTLTEANNWSGSFSELDEYKNGTKISYTVEEDEVAEYTTEITGDAAAGYTVTNSYVPETLDVNGTKTWNDANNQDGKRPESITVRLYANGTEKETVTVTEEDGWSYSFRGLDKYENGTEIVYTITEDAVADYTTEINGYDITNSYTPGKTGVNVVKNWNDANDQDGKRPESVTIRLYADGEDTGKTVTLTEANNWSDIFTDLDEYKNGTKISYTVEEDEVAEYTTEITGDAAAGYTVTNSYVPETIDVNGTKTWNDANNQDGKRPESITVRLYANGTEKETVTVTEEDGWSYSFRGLDKYENGSE